MAAGDLTVIEYLGTAPCHTPACGWKPGMATNGLADVFRIGRFTKIVCQRCGGTHGLSDHDLREMFKPDVADPVIASA